MTTKTESKLTLSNAKDLFGRNYFSGENMRFFGDISYDLRRAKSGDYYFINYTHGFSDMFSKTKTKHYRVLKMEVTDDRFTGKGDYLDEVIKDGELTNWLQNN